MEDDDFDKPKRGRPKCQPLIDHREIDDTVAAIREQQHLVAVRVLRYLRLRAMKTDNDRTHAILEKIAEARELEAQMFRDVLGVGGRRKRETKDTPKYAEASDAI